MSSLFETGIRPIINDHLAKLAEEKRDYGDYWSASSAGYCMRKAIFDRLQVPYTGDEVDEARKQRIFSSGHIFHEWIQRITADSGASIAQEIELLDKDFMIKGHCDDIIRVGDHLILYDYKTAHSRSFHYAKDRQLEVSHYHKMQAGTYMYMIRAFQKLKNKPPNTRPFNWDSFDGLEPISEARILKISKDDLTMDEQQIIYTPVLEKQVLDYWLELNQWWAEKKFPPCTCADYENGFMAREKYNPYFYKGEPCSLEWYKKVWQKEKRYANTNG